MSPGQPAQVQRRSSTAGALGCAAVLALLGGFWFVRPDGEQPTSAPSAAPAAGRRVPYRVVREWRIPNGGFGRVVVIDSTYRTDSGMAAPGEQLKYDTRTDRIAFIHIFDNARAAALRDSIEQMTRAERRFYDRHALGSYLRNANTGFHALQYSLAGVGGEVRTLRY